MTTVYNPYLPEYEYVPDGEPHVFGDRVYVYGSHDRAGANFFCVNDYVCWSAPVDDLGDWRFEGYIYHRKKDPASWGGLHLLFAPDCVQGADGKYYLFYGFDFTGLIGVAVCDEPAGEYEYLGHIQWPDGTKYGRRKGDAFGFDPGVLVDDDGRIWLFTGFAVPVNFIMTGFRKLQQKGGYLLELEPDMMTIKGDERLMFPLEGEGAFPAGHEFFEASSIRKFGDTYVFVYSSSVNHELCYATAKNIEGPYTYGGVLVSIGDVGLDGITDEGHARNYLGNTHGGMLKVGEGDDAKYYIFYHRQTNRTSYSRQACAEKLVGTPETGFAQAEVTSCGLNDGPLPGRGIYPARICCNIWASGHATGRYDVGNPKRTLADHPYVTQVGKDDAPGAYQYVANMRDGAVVGYKYFDLKGLAHIDVSVRGAGMGGFVVSTDEDFKDVIATINFSDLDPQEWREYGADVEYPNGIAALYFRYAGEDHVDFKSFTLS